MKITGKGVIKDFPIPTSMPEYIRQAPDPLVINSIILPNLAKGIGPDFDREIAMSPTINSAGDGLDHSNRQGMFLAVIIGFTIAATIMVLMRVYTRAMIVRSFGNGEYTNAYLRARSTLLTFLEDDWAIIACMVGFYTFIGKY